MSKYYKILPGGLNWMGFQYKEGLNIGTKKRTPYKCDDKWLHFSDAEHILYDCNYGPSSIIAEVELPKKAVVYHDLFPDQSKANRIILKNLRPLWSVDTIKDLIQEGVEFETYKNFMLRVASEYGHLDVVKYLVEQGANIHACDDGALLCASSDGHLNVVKYLVEQGANIHANYDDALRWASCNGYFNIVKYLVEQGADIHAVEDWAIRWAGTPEIKAYLKSLP